MITYMQHTWYNACQCQVQADGIAKDDETSNTLDRSMCLCVYQ